MNDLPIGRSVDEALCLVRAFQFTVSDLSYFTCSGWAGGAYAGRIKDEYGKVCPANWREGRKTVRGDFIATLGYFAAVDGQHENGKANCTTRVRVD
jgi:peroxiredoxin (alkyl hydroperoxide reductase subunit C)